MSGEIWVFAEERGGSVKPTSWEVLGAGQELARGLGRPLAAVVATADAGAAAEALATKRVDRVLALEGPALDPYTPDAHARALSRSRRPRLRFGLVWPRPAWAGRALRTDRENAAGRRCARKAAPAATLR